MKARSSRPPPPRSSSRPPNRTAPGTSSRRSCPTNPSRRQCMKKLFALVAAVALLASSVTPAFAQASSTLDKISQSGTLVIGTRTGSPPFAYVNKENQWVGFSIDLVEELIKPALEKKLGKPVKV